MDIFSALQTSVSGLQAQSYAISNISGNIANSQTTGYKRIDTSFVDLMSEQTPGREVAGSVLARAQLTNTLQGPIASSTTPTNMAINGQGFFTVLQKTGNSSGTATFGTPLYTRRGDFAPNSDGYLVNGAGDYLQGQNIDPATGQPTGTGAIKITNTSLPAKATTSITYAANLPTTPATTASAASGSSLYTGTALADVTSTNAPTFVANSIAGPAPTVYTATGAPVTVTTRWAKLADATSTTPAKWNLYYQADTTKSATASAWTNAGTDFTFDATGQLTSPSTGSATITALTVNGTNLGNVTLNVDKAGLTQYADSSGAARTDTLTQNGYASGTLKSVSVDSDGTINGSFSNGSVIPLATVGIVRFANPDGLKPDSNGNYLQTAESGSPLAGLAGSTIAGSSVEQSNTDIATEFSKMIVTQQAYSANTRVMSTAQTMMSDLLNVVR